MKVLFHNSEYQTKNVDPEYLQTTIHEDLNSHQENLRSLNVDDIISALQKFRLKLSDHRNPLQQKYRNLGLAFLLHFIHEDHLQTLLDLNLRDRYALDGIVKFQGQKIMAVPRGITGHWMAGNVPLLSFISVLQCLLTKNVSLVKLSSRTEDFISPLLAEMAQISECRQLSDAVTVLSFSSDDKPANLAMNDLCRTRIFWGSQEAVNDLKNMPKDPEVVDCVFGPKLSAAIIDPQMFDETAARSLATDITLFDQGACSSPHYLFVKGDKIGVVAELLSQALGKLDQGPLAPHRDAGETSRILNFRADWAIAGGKVVSDGTAGWTIALLDKELSTLPPAVGSRCVTVIPFVSYESINELLPDNTQTITTLLPDDELIAMVQLLSKRGVARFPLPGHANDYVLPWDGYFVLDRLVHWTVLA